MKVIVFGATGRVGAALVRSAVAAGHDVTVFVRDTAFRPAQGIQVVYGDARDAAAVTQALQGGFDVVFSCLGAGALKPSTLVTDATRALLAGMQTAGINRLIAVSGTAEMSNKTRCGRAYTAILKRTPVGHAVRDHDGAMTLIFATGLSWVLVGCNYIANGAARGGYKTSLEFPGGFKTIRAGDVADFMLTEAAARKYCQQVVGIWY